MMPCLGLQSQKRAHVLNWVVWSLVQAEAKPLMTQGSHLEFLHLQQLWLWEVRYSDRSSSALIWGRTVVKIPQVFAGKPAVCPSQLHLASIMKASPIMWVLLLVGGATTMVVCTQKCVWVQPLALLVLLAWVSGGYCNSLLE
jgi:hypothetical protein